MDGRLVAVSFLEGLPLGAVEGIGVPLGAELGIEVGTEPEKETV